MPTLYFNSERSRKGRIIKENIRFTQKKREIRKHIMVCMRFPVFLCVVCLAAHVSNGLKSRTRPVVGRIQPKARVSIVRWNLKEAGCEEHTNSRANLWSDEQKSHMRSCMWVRQQPMLKPNNYTESCMINEADGWRGRNVWYLGRSVRYALKEVTIA